MGHGIASDVWTTKYSDMKNMFISLPPLEQQRKISSYLEMFSAEMDKLIVSCELLIEQIQSFIHFIEFDTSNIANYENHIKNVYAEIYNLERRVFGVEQVHLRDIHLQTKEDLILCLDQCEYLLSLYTAYKMAVIYETLTGKGDLISKRG